ncbi:hypothetical protein [Chromobacterium haemolyticum]|uniref:Uncharacterized protein n=1 Tax=Chromobacterium haemolyticum TaxID=394935 RepID=A0A1W0CCM8_9NEIS|nr:hypothetical protein [Chromobacterium haemolyticum]OQS32484.1 hypothetical protein B0T45_21770 [Chromobacterium haemolyticum]
MARLINGSSGGDDMEKRSGATGIARGLQVGLSTPSQQMRVNINTGGRQGETQPATGGGGYLNVYTPYELPDGKKIARDPRLDDLRAMGMHHTWQRVAAEIGMDAFLAMWRILDAEEQFQHPKGGLELTLRRYRSFLMFQRNRFICQLAGAGLTNDEIRQRLDVGLCEKLENSRINNIIKGK